MTTKAEEKLVLSNGDCVRGVWRAMGLGFNTKEIAEKYSLTVKETRELQKALTSYKAFGRPLPMNKHDGLRTLRTLQG